MVRNEIVTVKMFANYNGHNVRQNGSINLTFKCDYGELSNSIQLLQLLNNDINVIAKVASENKPFKIGSFRLKGVTIDDDGESKITFNSITDYVEIDNINKLITNETFKLKCVAEVEIESDDNEEENSEEE